MNVSSDEDTRKSLEATFLSLVAQGKSRDDPEFQAFRAQIYAFNRQKKLAEESEFQQLQQDQVSSKSSKLPPIAIKKGKV
jgi:hypothetical protein